MRLFKRATKSARKWLYLYLPATAFCVSLAPAALADEPVLGSYAARAVVPANFSEMPVQKSYALGIGRFDLDAHTEIIGWRLNHDWYFGRQDGEDSGLTLVWQSNANQISLSKDGLRLTRRF